MPRSTAPLRDQLHTRARIVSETFGIASRQEFQTDALRRFPVSDDLAHRLEDVFNIEWHVIPPMTVVPFDAAYLARMYPQRSHTFEEAGYETISVRRTLEAAHARIEGRIVGVETTQKPIYLPANTQFYGSIYGLDPTFDPLRTYFEQARLQSGPRFINSRFAQTPATLRSLAAVVIGDWKTQGFIPPGYELAVCPPTVFNLVGLLFHPEWSQTATLELSAYHDDRGNAVGLAVGSNGPGDFSYVRRLGHEADLSQLGFRIALVPSDSGAGARSL
jgi:hypothetical protein